MGAAAVSVLLLCAPAHAGPRREFRSPVVVPFDDARIYLRINISGDSEPSRTIADAFKATWGSGERVTVVSDAKGYADFELWIQAAETADGARKAFAVSHVLVDTQLASMPPELIEAVDRRRFFSQLRPYTGSALRHARLSLIDAVDVLPWATQLAGDIETEELAATPPRRVALVTLLTQIRVRNGGSKDQDL